jgi:hypothetical protein
MIDTTIYPGTAGKPQLLTGEEQNMKGLCLAIFFLGLWVLFGTLFDGKWVGIVFGALAALMALMGFVTLNNSGSTGKHDSK